MKRPNRISKAIPCPDREAISRALNVLEDQRLHVYQVLYYEGLANPDGRPLKVERKFTGNSMTVSIKVSYSAIQNLDYNYFTVIGTESDEAIIEKANLLLSSGGKKVTAYACCSHAEKNPCVCMYSFKCPLHGEIHIGSHD